MANFATPESTVIQLRFDLIARVCGANLLALAEILYSKSIITSEELEAIHKETPAVHKDVPKAVSLITTILNKVDADSSVFYQFVSILRDNDHPNLAALLVSDLTTESVYRRHEQLQKLSRKESLAEEQESTQSLLSIRDFVKVCNKLYAASMKWYEIGDILKINKRKLDKIKQQNKSMKTCFFEMVYEWLENGEERTWLALSHSLRSDTVNFPDIADQLEKLSKEECLIEEQETTKPHQLEKLSREESLVEEQETTKSRGVCNLPNAIKYVKKRKFPSSKAEALGHALKTVSYSRIQDIMANWNVHGCFQLALIYIIQHWLDNEPQPEWEKLAKALDGNFAVVAKAMRGCSGKPITLGEIMTVLLNYEFSTSTNLGEVLALKLEVPYDTICANRGLTSKFDMALMDILEAWFDSDLDPSWYKLDQALQETDQKELSIKDFAKVCNRLYAARMKWYEIGIMLKIDARKLYTIKQQNKATKTCFFEMVYEWLVSGEERTWLALSHSLRSEIVQFPEIADQLQKLSGEESSVEEQETAKSQSGTLSITNLDEVRASLYDARTMWYEIGIGLHIDKTTLNKIKETNKLVDSCFEKMLEEWLNNGVNRTWAILVRAVGSKIVGYSDITAHLTKVPAESVEEPTCKDSSIFWSNQLSCDDLENIYETVYEARKKWYMIGVMLRIGVDKLDEIKRKFGETELCSCFKEMLKVWLNSSSERTWRILAAVLQSDCIGFPGIADKISAESLETSFTTTNSCHLNITNLPEIYDILFCVREKWKEIGIQLKFDLDTLDIIGDEFDDPEHCLLELLKKWLHNSIDTTWYTLTDCIQKIISYLVKRPDSTVAYFSRILNLLKRKILKFGEVLPKPCNQISVSNLPEICECMYMAFSKWQTIGRVLQISEGALNYIKGKINGYAECFVHMIMKWLEVSINPNWMALAHACTIVGYHFISSTLLQMSLPSDKQHLKASPQLLDTLSNIHPEIHNAKQKWYMIGMKLRLDTATLDVIKMEANDQDECFNVMINKWINTPNSSPAILVGALQSEIVDYPAIANELLEGTVDYADSPTSLDELLEGTVDYAGSSTSLENCWQVARVVGLYLGIIIFLAISFGHPVQEQGDSGLTMYKMNYADITSFIYRGNFLKWSWERHSLWMTFESESLPNDIPGIQVNVKAILWENFILPDNKKPASTFFSIEADYKFQKKIWIKIGHFAADKSNLTFLISYDKHPPYTFQLLSGGMFFDDYGIVLKENFSKVVVATDTQADLVYQATLYSSRENQNTWDIHLFLTIRDKTYLNSMKEHIKKEYNKPFYRHSSCVLTVGKDSKDLTMNISLNEIEVKNGWYLPPNSMESITIFKEIIPNTKTSSVIVDEEFTIGRNKISEPLIHMYILEGTKKLSSHLKLKIPTHDESEYSIFSSSDLKITKSSSFGNKFGLELSEVHNKGINGTGIKLAIIDYCSTTSNGIYADHKALQRDSCDIQFDKIDCDIDDTVTNPDHALLCTSIAVGSKFSDAMYPDCDEYVPVTYPGGVAPGANATVYLTSKWNQSSFITALNKVHEGMFDVLSISLGYDEEYPSIKQAIDNLKSRTMIIAAAGNFGNTRPVMFPARHHDVISVGATDANFKVSSFSANNDYVDIFYFGEMYVPSSHNDNTLQWTSGTSLAAPGIAGIVSLIIQSAKKHGYHREIKNNTIITRLLKEFMTIEESKTYVPNITFLIEAHQNKNFFETVLLNCTSDTDTKQSKLDPYNISSRSCFKKDC